MNNDFVTLVNSWTFTFLSNFDCVSGFLCLRLNIYHFNSKLEHRVSRDFRLLSASIAVVRWANQFRFTAFCKSNETLFPAFYERSFADCESQGLSSVIRGIEFGAIEKSASVMGCDFVTFLDNGTISFGLNGDRKFCWIRLLRFL